MIVIGSALFGAIVGALTARKRGGKAADIAQYAAASAMAFGVVGMIATVIVHRIAV